MGRQPRYALSPSGLVLVDKPPGPSSFAIVRELRDRTGARAGHAGTLDPFASGLLLVLLGSATRLARYLVGLDKRYETEIDLRARTTTGDPEGDVVEEHDAPQPSELEGRVASLRGDVELRVPAASAVKVGGERAYRLARRGVAVEMPVRRSTVYALELLRYEDGIAHLSAHVSSGTYVRSLAEALGGHCCTLRRTAVGPFEVDDADVERVLVPADALPFLPAVDVSDDEAAAVRAGRTLPCPNEPWLVPGTCHGRIGREPVRIVSGGDLVAVARVADGRLRPETVLRA
jgi:tRNA pseudouridine55 synthase